MPGPLLIVLLGAACAGFVQGLAGAYLYRRFSDTAFRRLVLLSLTASGALPIVSALHRAG